MSKLAVLFASVLLASGQLLAAENLERVVLDSKVVHIHSDHVLLVRTAKTPSVVKLHMEIPYTRYVCLEWDSREVYGPDSSCGTDTVCRTVCSTECDVWFNGHCAGSHESCSNECSEVTRSCLHTESYCVRSGDETTGEDKTARLHFKNVAELSDGDEELFELKGWQKKKYSYNDKYELKVVRAKGNYKTGYVDFFGDWLSVKGK